MRSRFIMIFFAMLLAFVSVSLDEVPLGHDESMLTLRAIEPADSSIPRGAGTVAVTLVGLYLLLALASSPSFQRGNRNHVEDLFLKVRLIPETGGASPVGEAYLRTLSKHRATMISREPLAEGLAVTLRVPGKKPEDFLTFHARVVRCRPPREDHFPFVVRLALDHDREGQAAIRSEIDALRHSPAALSV